MNFSLAEEYACLLLPNKRTNICQSLWNLLGVYTLCLTIKHSEIPFYALACLRLTDWQYRCMHGASYANGRKTIAIPELLREVNRGAKMRYFQPYQDSY